MPRFSPSLVVLTCLVVSGSGCPLGEVAGEGEGEGEGAFDPPSSVLLIGNSQLGLNPPDVAAALARLSADEDDKSAFTVDRQQNFGEGCAEFFARPEVTDAASAVDHDVVVLVPAINEDAGDSECWDAFRDIIEGAGSRLAMMATANTLASYPEGFDALHDVVASYAEARALQFIPAGRVWREVLGDAPTPSELSEMYSSDAEHPGAEGDLIYVYTMYAVLTGRSAVGLPPDVEELRCDFTIDEPCLSYEELDACVDESGAYNCAPQNGALFGPNGVGVAFVSPEEAASYQAAVDAVLGR